MSEGSSLPATVYVCAAADRAKGSDHMDVDKHENVQQHVQEGGGHARPEQGGRDMEDIDYNGRRQSVVAGGVVKPSV